MTMASAFELLLLFVLGCGLEFVVFSRGEWDRYSPAIAQLYTTALLSTSFLLKLCGYSWTRSFIETAAFSSTLLCGLFLSMILYRTVFHNLKGFPGPFSARLTAFWAVKKSIPRLQFYRTVQKLHEELGDFVRIRKRRSV